MLYIVGPMSIFWLIVITLLVLRMSIGATQDRDRARDALLTITIFAWATILCALFLHWVG
jgi:predicted metal-binding membrane protein